MNPGRTLREIAAYIGGTVLGDPDRVITGARAIAGAGPGDLVFVDGDSYRKELATSKAGAAILPEGVEPPAGMGGIRCRQPALGMAKALELIAPRARSFIGVSPQAFLGKDVELGEEVGIGPGAFIGDDVRIGRGTEVHPGVTIGAGSTIGEHSILYCGVHIYNRITIGSRVVIHSGAVIGADGFGFVQETLAPGGAPESEPVRHRKVPQIGTVIIEDDVEIGANTTIDRAALDVTFIGRGTKIDDQVMVGHNCRIGRHCLLVAHAAISGSTVLGDYVTIAGQAGLAGHLHVGHRAIIGAQAGVTKDVPDGHVLLGSPAIDARQARRAYTLLEHLPEYRRAISNHEERLAALEGKEPSPRRP